MKKIISLIFILIFAQFLVGQTSSLDGEFLKVTKEYSLNEDGSMDFHYYKELKLHSHYAFHRLYGETFIVYNPEFEELKINLSYTIMADGKQITSPQNAFNEVLPRFATNAPSLNHLREMVVTHTGLEVGATIYLDYIIHSKRGYYPALMIDEEILESSPTNELGIRVNVPAGTPVDFQLLNIEGKPEQSTKKGMDRYTWAFNSLPAAPKDYYQVSNHLDAPRLLFSTAKDINTLIKSFTEQQAFDFETNAAMDELVGKVCADNSDQLSVALALQNVVSTDLSTLAVPLKYTGYSCRTPIETWESNKGTQLEKVLLLTTLLQKAEIAASPIAVLPAAYFDIGIGDLSNFNKFLVRLDMEAYGAVYISADQIDQQNQKFKLSGHQLLVLDPDKKDLEVYSLEEENNKIWLDGKFVVDDQAKLFANIKLILEANSNPYISIFTDPTAIKSMIRGGLGSTNVTAFKSVELTQKKSNTFLDYEKEGAFELLHNYMEFKLPYVSNGVDSWHINLLTEDRTSALEIPELIHERYTYSFELPDDYQVVLPVKDIEVKNALGHLIIQFDTSNNKLEVIREIQLEKKTIERKDYDKFKAIMDVWNNPIYKKVIFKK